MNLKCRFLLPRRDTRERTSSCESTLLTQCFLKGATSPLWTHDTRGKSPSTSRLCNRRSSQDAGRWGWCETIEMVRRRHDTFSVNWYYSCALRQCEIWYKYCRRLFDHSKVAATSRFFSQKTHRSLCMNVSTVRNAFLRSFEVACFSGRFKFCGCFRLSTQVFSTAST